MRVSPNLGRSHRAGPGTDDQIVDIKLVIWFFENTTQMTGFGFYRSAHISSKMLLGNCSKALKVSVEKCRSLPQIAGVAPLTESRSSAGVHQHQTGGSAAEPPVKAFGTPQRIRVL